MIKIYVVEKENKGFKKLAKTMANSCNCVNFKYLINGTKIC